MHGVATLHYQSDTVIEPQGAVGGESGVLAEAVSSANARLDAQALDGVQHHQTADKRGELGVAGVFQFLSVGIEQ